MKPIIKIVNVVASGALNQEIDLDSVVKAFPDVEYRPMTFPGAPFRLDSPKSCTLLFNSGKMVCTGTKNTKYAKKAVIKVTKKLEKAGIITPGSKPEVTINNLVASVTLRSVSIDLEDAYYKLNERGKVLYEPEQFPGIVFRMKNPKVVFLIFRSGKLVCVGAKREEDIYEAVDELTAILEEENLLIEERFQKF